MGKNIIIGGIILIIFLVGLIIAFTAVLVFSAGFIQEGALICLVRDGQDAICGRLMK